MNYIFINNISDKYVMSSSFIKITNKLNIINIPIITNNIPVISCIGTSRDGKSTLLNIYCEFIFNKYNIKNKPKLPFITEQSDDAITNGIDFYKIKDKCLLLDCQGMQLENAKYDHYLALINYLISNVIILTVRQRLDLQVLNNLLGIFSFLSEIPEEYKRTDKPKLIIRIKDFQNIKALKENPNYLNELINKWLEKSNDQYDQIKDAFKITFDIFPIATLTPKYDNDDEILDIYSKTFNFKNPSFKNACDKIYELTQNCDTSYLLKDNEKIKNLINKLKENKEIDFRKLDLYHNITNVELLKYLNNNINIEPYTDKSLLDQLTGSITCYNQIIYKEESINKLKDHTYNIKFKDVPINIKDEIFNDAFNNFYDFLIICKEKNIMIASGLVKPHIINFSNKFDNIEYEDKNYISIFKEKEKILKLYLNEIDKTVCDRCIIKIDNEFERLNSQVEKIELKNSKQIKLIELLITKYNVSEQYILKIDEIINSIDSEYDFSKLENIDTVINDITLIIIQNIEAIIETNNNFSYLDKNYNESFKTKKKYNIDSNKYIVNDETKKYIINKLISSYYCTEYQYEYEEFWTTDDKSNINYISEINFVKIFSKKSDTTLELTLLYSCWMKEMLQEKLNKVGLLNVTLKPNNFKYITFCYYRFGSLEPYIMTDEFYSEIFEADFLPNINKHINESGEYDDMPFEIDGDNVDGHHYDIEKLIPKLNNNNILKVLEDKFLFLLFEFILNYNKDNK